MRGPNKFLLFKDGNMWCAVPPRFVNYAEDPSGWGETQEQAIVDLAKQPEYFSRAPAEGWKLFPSLVDFDVIPEGEEFPFELGEDRHVSNKNSKVAHLHSSRNPRPGARI